MDDGIPVQEEAVLTAEEDVFMEADTGMSREAILTRIEEYALEYIMVITSTGASHSVPAFHIPAFSYEHDDRRTVRARIRRTSRRRMYSVRSNASAELSEGPFIRVSPEYVRMWTVLSRIHQLLVSHSRVSIRELFYLLKPFFSTQRKLNATVTEVAAMIGCPRHALNLTTTGRGFLCGLVCDASESTALFPVSLAGTRTSIPGDVSLLHTVRFASADERPLVAILVIEKDAVFQRLVEEGFPVRARVVLVTGCGFPDVATRVALSCLARQLQIPVFGLYDFNPSGFAIHLCYAHGSQGMVLESHAYTVPIQWLGMFAADAEALVPLQHRLPYTEYDMRVLRRIQAMQVVREDATYAREVAAFGALLWKAEIEAFYVDRLPVFVSSLHNTMLNLVASRTTARD
eukprot:ANDGO_08276.mRNA.1 Meiotic recombination protein SPO11-2